MFAKWGQVYDDNEALCNSVAAGPTWANAEGGAGGSSTDGGPSWATAGGGAGGSRRRERRRNWKMNKRLVILEKDTT